MEARVDKTARRLDRANVGIRALRVHLYLLAVGLIGQFLGQAGLFLYQTLAEKQIDLTWLGSLTGQDYGEVNLPLVVAMPVAALLIGGGLNALVASGSRGGLTRILLGVFLVVWFILGQFFFYPSSWGMIESRGYWPTQFLVIYWGGVAIFVTLLAYAVYGILGLRHPQARAWLTSVGHGQSTARTLALLYVGPLNRGATSGRRWAVVFALVAAFLLGWGIYLLYSIPLGAMAIISIAEARIVLGERILDYTVIAALAKVFAAYCLITGGRIFLRMARLAAMPRVAASVASPPAALYLRPFRFDNAEFDELKRGLGPRFFDLDTGAHVIEEIVVGLFARLGPVLAIGAPTMRGQQDGTVRLHLGAAEDWKTTVEGLMRESRVIVIVVDETDGVLWELQTITRLGLWPKTVIVLPGEETQRRWSDEFVSLVLDLLVIDPEDLPGDEPRSLVVAAKPSASEITLFTSSHVRRGAYQAAIGAAGAQALSRNGSAACPRAQGWQGNARSPHT